MKHSTLFVSIIFTVFLFPGLTSAEGEYNKTSFTLKVAKSGCCKSRNSSQYPWEKIHNNFDRCKAANDSQDGDGIYQNMGSIWWDRSCR
ncbi:MAG: hypothetical protein GY744_04070 [Gammaproteobacteria bacterium]|nr:hypothetical protein [Gammaproteobacteria bacterium]